MSTAVLTSLVPGMAPGTILSAGQTKAILLALGFRVTGTASIAQAVGVFQDANRLTTERLAVDRKVGPRTSELLAFADWRRRGGLSTLSEHFSWAEFACRGGDMKGCRGNLVVGPLIDAAEVIRAEFYDDGLHVVSGYRCAEHNGDTPGAATGSQHPYGGGLDIAPRVTPRKIADLGVVSGIGYRARGGLVCHVDVRGIGPADRATPNRTGSTRSKPAVFVDG